MADVIAMVDDLFFASKIRGAAEQAAVRVTFAKSIDQVVSAADGEKPALVIADLNSSRCDPVALAARLKSDANLGTVPLLGFFSHVDAELQRRARAAGFDQTIPRSAFAATLGKLFAEISQANRQPGLSPGENSARS